MELNSRIAPGTRFKTRNDDLIQVITIGKMGDTQEKIVVYQQLFGEYEIYADLLPLWEHKFLQDTSVQLSGSGTKSLSIQIDTGNEKKQELCEEKLPKENLIRFLDADTCKEKLAILMDMEQHIDEELLDNIAVSLDLAITDTDFNDRLEGIKDYLKTRIRFEDKRLR